MKTAIFIFALLFLTGCSVRDTGGQILNDTKGILNDTKDFLNNTNDVKEFDMTAFYNDSGRYFSLKEIEVDKGDTVRINVTNIRGMHDFVLQDYNIDQELPLNQPVIIEFVADKEGEFEYNCSYPGHRAGGQWGILRVK